MRNHYKHITSPPLCSIVTSQSRICGTTLLAFQNDRPLRSKDLRRSEGHFRPPAVEDGRKVAGEAWDLLSALRNRFYRTENEAEAGAKLSERGKALAGSLQKLGVIRNQ